jgi:hypothetical protein
MNTPLRTIGSRIAGRLLLVSCLAVVLASGSLASSPDHSTALQSRQVNRLTIVLSGRMVFDKGVQEGILLAVPWGELADQFFPRQAVPIVVELWRGGSGGPLTLVDDARKRPFEPERAKAVLARSFGYGQGSLRLFCVPDLCHIAHWMRPFLERAGLSPSDPIANAPALGQEASALWVRGG